MEYSKFLNSHSKQPTPVYKFCPVTRAWATAVVFFTPFIIQQFIQTEQKLISGGATFGPDVFAYSSANVASSIP